MMQGYMGPGNFGGFGNLGGMSPHGFGNGGWMAGPDLTWILLFALLAIAAYVVFKKKQTANGAVNQEPALFHSNSEAEELVKLRYARGEITNEQYQSIITTIRS
ncbi:hypothetical protein [Thalassobacillus devorans]|jgi:putative membrane protein|uniref:hypothetical protein n=1 Tax=Thalassobacillus devorans TaxID=279813 RepID=UPI000490599E|nr:hypothetical protein [Thalassobacillus devorans]